MSVARYALRSQMILGRFTEISSPTPGGRGPSALPHRGAASYGGGDELSTWEPLRELLLHPRQELPDQLRDRGEPEGRARHAGRALDGPRGAPGEIDGQEAVLLEETPFAPF